jgi:hypothetical protein
MRIWSVVWYGWRMNDTDFKSLIEKIKTVYFSIGHITCPAFNGKNIYFDHRGFDHLFTSNQNHRTQGQILRRVRLFPYAIKLVTLTNNIFGHSVEKRGSRVYHFYVLQNRINSVQIRVIIGQLDNTCLHFLSVMDIKQKASLKGFL